MSITGWKIRERRELLNMSQEELAKRSNVSRATISALETNRNYNVSTHTIMKIATALETTVSDLFFADSV